MYVKFYNHQDFRSGWGWWLLNADCLSTAWLSTDCCLISMCLMEFIDHFWAWKEYFMLISNTVVFVRLLVLWKPARICTRDVDRLHSKRRRVVTGCTTLRARRAVLLNRLDDRLNVKPNWCAPSLCCRSLSNVSDFKCVCYLLLLYIQSFNRLKWSRQ